TNAGRGGGSVAAGFAGGAACATYCGAGGFGGGGGGGGNGGGGGGGYSGGGGAGSNVGYDAGAGGGSVVGPEVLPNTALLTAGATASGDGAVTITLVAAEAPVTIGDFVWRDANGNGVQDAGEPGLAGVTLTLTGTDAAGRAVTDHATTDASGRYLFTEAAGTYTVAVDGANFGGAGALAGYTASPTRQGTDAARDANPDPSGTTPGTLAAGAADLAVDFGFTPPKQPQAFALTSAPPASAVVTSTFALSATPGASGTPVVFASQTAATCTTTGPNGTTLTLTGAGPCTVQATEAGTATYADAPAQTLTVAVLTPAQAVGRLRQAVADANLGGPADGLLVKLDAAAAAFARGDPAAVCGALGAFQHELQAQRGKHVPVATADAWLAQAAQTRTALGC
ncbi:MAG TPA: SdrD B-like domain-containing protein, partial [Gemmatirosa sp.]